MNISTTRFRLCVTALALLTPVAATALDRPSDKLMVVSGGANGVVFVAPDKTVRKGDIADILVLDVFDPGLAVGQSKIVEVVTRRRLDCAARTFQDLESSGYDNAGKMVISMPQTPAQPIPQGSGNDFLAMVTCDGAEPPQKMFASGHEAALKMGRELLAAHR